jgi:hypothetical protein
MRVRQVAPEGWLSVRPGGHEPESAPRTAASVNRTVIAVHDSGRLYHEAIIFTTTGS